MLRRTVKTQKPKTKKRPAAAHLDPSPDTLLSCGRVPVFLHPSSFPRDGGAGEASEDRERRRLASTKAAHSHEKEAPPSPHRNLPACSGHQDGAINSQGKLRLSYPMILCYKPSQSSMTSEPSRCTHTKRVTRPRPNEDVWFPLLVPQI